MPFIGNLYQLAVVLFIGIVGAFRSDYTRSQTAALGAKVSFIFGTALMLFSENRWWPVTFSIAALVTWTLSGWLIASLGFWFTARIRGL